ncbi:MAG TPA: hypothetical protein VIT89_12260 [Solirubrobacterales bacterium]
MMKGGDSIDEDGSAQVVFKAIEPSQEVPFECVLDLDDFGVVLGIEVLDFKRQIGVKPPPYDPSKGMPRWSYDEEIDAFYVRFVDRHSPRQEVREGSAFVDPEGSVVSLEAKV